MSGQDFAWVVVFVWAACAAFGYAIGRPKGLGTQGFFLGLVLGIVGLAVIAVLETADSRRYPNAGLRWWGGPSAPVQLSELLLLRQEGLVTGEEFAAARQQLLPRAVRTRPAPPPDGPLPPVALRSILGIVGVALAASTVWAAVALIGSVPAGRDRVSTDSGELFAALRDAGWACTPLSDDAAVCSPAGDPARATIRADGSAVRVETSFADESSVDPAVLLDWLQHDLNIQDKTWERISDSQYLDGSGAIDDVAWSWSDGDLSMTIRGG